MLDKFPIDSLPRTSAVTIRRLKKIGVNTFWQLINYFPFRYSDYSLISPFDKVQQGETITIRGRIKLAKNEYTRRGLTIQKAVIYDENEQTITAYWYNQPFLVRLLRIGVMVSLAGEIKKRSSQLVIEPQEYEIIQDARDSNYIHTGRLVPVYPEKSGLSSRTIREKIFFVLEDFLGKSDHLPDFLPHEIKQKYDLFEEINSYHEIHFPSSWENQRRAHRRLSFDELFFFQLAASIIKEQWQQKKISNPIYLNDEKKEKVQLFIHSLPFKLTGSQKQAVREILKSIADPKPMNRLLQGDVGSGKTVVAAIACYAAFLNGYQSLIMAPTELLARQHYQTLKSVFKNKDVTIDLLTSSYRKGDFHSDIIVGTHALLESKVNLKRAALVVIDEQHRFGVRQRALLREQGSSPHVLTMTATPIPRTIALVLYNKLDMTVLNEMPSGRLRVKTFLVPHKKRQAAYQWIKQQVMGRQIQVFIVCPFIEESSVETLKSVRAAKNEFEYLKSAAFPGLSISLLHGKLKSSQKNSIMEAFRDNEVSILVTTPLVEVGIDVPNATIMMIEGAERFGLAQLHQLRGRVGRADKQSYCLLFTSSEDQSSNERLRYFSKTYNGIALAEFDLKRRGPGTVFGTKQHGFEDLKIASFSDTDIILQAKEVVNHFIGNKKLLSEALLKKRMVEYEVQYVTPD